MVPVWRRRAAAAGVGALLAALAAVPAAADPGARDGAPPAEGRARAGSVGVRAASAGGGAVADPWVAQHALARIGAADTVRTARPALARVGAADTVRTAQRGLARIAAALGRSAAGVDDAFGLGSTTAVGGSHTCGVVLFAHVWCWGANNEAQLGVGTVGGSAGPVRPSATGGLREKVVLGLSAGREHTCAISFDPEGFGAWCWGANGDGQIGDGGTTRRTRPVQVAADAIMVAAGAAHTCVVTVDLTVSCWGANDVGQLGIGATGPSDPTPQEVPGLTDVVGISANENNTCALREDGTAWCWGSDTHGQLGDGGGASGTPVATPAAVTMTGISGGFAQVSVGRRHVCALQAVEAATAPAYCWGEDADGQLGNAASAADFSRPGRVAGTARYVSVSAGGDSTCAVAGTGRPYCWGANPDGQLGTGNPGGHAAPAAVDLRNVVLAPPIRLLYGTTQPVVAGMTVGAAHACAADIDMAVYCTGRNDAGQLGAGSADASVLRAVPLRPGPPAGVRTRAGDGQLTVRWAAPADPGPAPVEQYVAVAADGSTPEDLSEAESCEAFRAKLTCTVGGLRNDRRHTVFVLAVTAGGISYSAFAYGTPRADGSGGGLPITGPGAAPAAGLTLVLTGAALTLLGRRPRRR
jgi:alpha-tubulin suppressor-like RCC1 family protein